MRRHVYVKVREGEMLLYPTSFERSAADGVSQAARIIASVK